MSESSSNNVLQDTNLHQSECENILRRQFEIEGDAFVQNEDIFLSSSSVDEPKNIKEVLLCPANDKWQIALQEKMNSAHQNNVWILVNLPPRRKDIGNKWILKIKRKVDDIVERYKFRLVAQGYAQPEGVDEETFSPIVRFSPIYNILAIAVHLDLKLHQMDVKTAFLNGKLHEKIYL